MSKQEKIITFTKEQFLRSNKFSNVEKDAIQALLTDNEGYTFEEVQKILEDFKSRKVR